MKSFLIICLFLISDSFAQNKDLNIKLSLGFNFSNRSNDVKMFNISPVIEINYIFNNNWFIGSQVGFSYLRLDRDAYSTQTRFDIGNQIISIGKKNLNISSGEFYTLKYRKHTWTYFPE